MFRSYKVDLPATGNTNDPNTLVYEFETGDQEVWIRGSSTVNTSYLTGSSTLTTSGFACTGQDFHAQVGPGDSLYAWSAGVSGVRVMVRTESE